MMSLGTTADTISSADDQLAQIARKLDGLLKEPVDVSSFTLTHGSLLSELKVQICYFPNIHNVLLKEKYPCCASNLCRGPLGDG